MSNGENHLNEQDSENRIYIEVDSKWKPVNVYINGVKIEGLLEVTCKFDFGRWGKASSNENFVEIKFAPTLTTIGIYPPESQVEDKKRRITDKDKKRIKKNFKKEGE